MERHTQDESKKDERVKLILPEGQSMMAVEHTGLDPRFGQFRDRLEALCGLPNQDDLPRILEVSNASALPAIWGRARLPPLEEKAIVIFVALAFSSKNRRLRWLQEFFKHEGWQIDLRGRPRLDPRDEDPLPVMRGLQIDRIIGRLKPGYLLKAQLKTKGGYNSDDEQIAKRLEGQGRDADEIKAIMEARSLQDAACRYFCETQHGMNVSRKSVRNDYAKFKRLKRRFPSFFANIQLATMRRVPLYSFF
jgi:hypothetical protein